MRVTREQLNNLVKRIIDASHPLRIILFGSIARGEDRPYSDLDIMVIMPNGTHRRETARKIYRHLLGFGVPVDIIVATPEDIEKYSGSSGLIYKEALKDGKELYAA